MKEFFIKDIELPVRDFVAIIDTKSTAAYVISSCPEDMPAAEASEVVFSFDSQTNPDKLEVNRIVARLVPSRRVIASVMEWRAVWEHENEFVPSLAETSRN